MYSDSRIAYVPVPVENLAEVLARVADLVASPADDYLEEVLAQVAALVAAADLGLGVARPDGGSTADS